MPRAVKLGVAVATLLAASAAVGNVPGGGLERAAYSLRISGWVPVICRVSLAQSVIPIAASEARVQVRLGALQEFCNSPNGYDVWVDHAPSAGASFFVVDGARVPFSTIGSTRISDSMTAGLRDRDLGLELDNPHALTALSLRIVAR